jgi:PIN domain nuclease of toxin-antitoxin system
MPGLLLDTCAIIFVAENQAIDPTAAQRIRTAGISGGVLVSPISAWEIGILAARGRLVFVFASGRLVSLIHKQSGGPRRPADTRNHDRIELLARAAAQ